MKVYYSINNSNNSLEEQIQNKPKISAWMSWPVIIILFIIFWPVGLFLLIKRINYGKKSETHTGRGTRIIGWFFVVLAASVAYGAGSEGITGTEVGLTIFFLAVGTIMIFIGRKRRANAAKLKEDINFVEIVIPEQENNTEKIIVTCKSCGANNTIIMGSVGKCEYCGSPIA